MALTTYRRNGTPVITPVWFVKQGYRLMVWTINTPTLKSRQPRPDRPYPPQGIWKDDLIGMIVTS